MELDLYKKKIKNASNLFQSQIRHNNSAQFTDFSERHTLDKTVHMGHLQRKNKANLLMQRAVAYKCL